MGFRLANEVSDHWRDLGLTPGERSDLLVIALIANDETRDTALQSRGIVDQPYILNRAGKLSAQSWKNAISALLRKRALTHAEEDGRKLAGQRGHVAVYKIPVLCPTPPHDGYLGQCRRGQAERVTREVTQSGGKGNPTGYPIDQRGEAPERVTPQVTQSLAQGHLPDDPAEGKGHPTGVEWVTPEVTPIHKDIRTTYLPDAEPPATGEPGRQAPPNEDAQNAAVGVRETARTLARRFDFGRQLQDGEKRRVFDELVAKLEGGWTSDKLFRAVNGNEWGSSARHPVAVLLARLRGLGPPSAPPARREAAGVSVPTRPPKVTSPDDESPGAAQFRAARRARVPSRKPVAAKSPTGGGEADLESEANSMPHAAVRDQLTLLAQGADAEKRQRGAHNGRQAASEPPSQPTATGDVLARVSGGSEADDSDAAADEQDDDGPEFEF